MKLTKTQITYALTRLNDKIHERKKSEIKHVQSKLDNKEAVYTYLTSIGVPLIDREAFNEEYSLYHLTKWIKFPEDFDKEHNEYTKTNREMCAKYDKLEQDIKDKLYLCGDAAEALNLINSI